MLPPNRPKRFSTRIAVSVPPEMHTALVRIAERDARTVAECQREALRRYIETEGVAADWRMSNHEDTA